MNSVTSASSLDEDKDLLLSRFKDYKWIDDLTGFQCVRCNKVLIRHYIANCGHKFCLNCKKLLDDGSKRWRCPIQECNKFIEDIHLQDVFFEDTVFELKSHCPNHKYGCSFIGPLKDIMGHLKKCKDTRENALPVLLNQSKGLDSAFVIKQMSKLNEKLETMTLSFNEMQKAMEEEKLVQERKWVKVDSRLHEVVSDMHQLSTKIHSITMNDEIGKIKEEMLYLKTKCERLFEILELSERKFKESENLIKIESRQMKSQLRDEISVIKKKVEETEEKIRGNETPSPSLKLFNHLIKPEVQHFRRVSEYYKEKPDFTWYVSGMKDFINGKSLPTRSEVFSLDRYPFAGAQAKLEFLNDQLWFNLVFTDKTNKQMEMKPTPRIYFTLKDQNNSNHILITRYFSYKADKLRYDTFYGVYAPTVNKNTIDSTPYKANNKIALDIHVEAPDVARMVYSNDGTLTWSIDEYRTRKQMETEGLIESYLSLYFYTNPKGYRVQVKTYLNGCNKFTNKRLSAVITFINGLYDEEHRGTFPHKTTVIIFHPTQHTRMISKSVVNDNYVGVCVIDIGTHADVENLLYNGTLYYHVTIEGN